MGSLFPLLICLLTSRVGEFGMFSQNYAWIALGADSTLRWPKILSKYENQLLQSPGKLMGRWPVQLGWRFIIPRGSPYHVYYNQRVSFKPSRYTYLEVFVQDNMSRPDNLAWLVVVSHTGWLCHPHWIGHPPYSITIKH